MEKEILCYKGDHTAEKIRWIDSDSGNETCLPVFLIHEAEVMFFVQRTITQLAQSKLI